MIDSFRINLQLFAGEKTEKATPRRREDARKKGQVAKSSELVNVSVLALTFLMLKLWFVRMIEEFAMFFNHVFTYAASDLTSDKAVSLVLETELVLIKMAGPLLGIAVVAGLAANLLQVGFLFTTETLKFDLTRLNPVSGLKRILSKRSLVELFKSIFKIGLVGFVAWLQLKKHLPQFSLMMSMEIIDALTVLSEAVFSTGWRILAVLLVLAVADYTYQIYEYEESLKMSKEDIKEEYKKMEGDPLVKSKIKERQRQMATRRMMQEVPKSTVVITNPTHIAVALKYEDNMSAPLLVAKGKGFVAQRIKEIAQDSDVAIVENKMLARLLFSKVEIGRVIPAELYQAVAEVIAYVYKLKKRV